MCDRALVEKFTTQITDNPNPDPNPNANPNLNPNPNPNLKFTTQPS